MHQIRVSPCSGNSCGKGILKHIAGASGILTDNNTALLCAFIRKIIGQELSHLKGGIRCQIYVSLSTITVCSKIFSHLFSLLFCELNRYFFRFVLEYCFPRQARASIPYFWKGTCLPILQTGPSPLSIKESFFIPLPKPLNNALKHPSNEEGPEIPLS